MEGKSSTSLDPNTMKQQEEDDGSSSFQDFVNTLEKQTNWDGRPLVRYEGFLLVQIALRPVMSFRKHFKARDEDVIVASLPKSGTTWLKALTFAIARRATYDPFDGQTHPLLSENPHLLVPFFEFTLYMHEENPDLEHFQDQEPRIFGTHIPFGVLPNSILESKCKIIYICRNPLDQFVSFRHFSLANDFRKFHNCAEEPLGLNESFDMFCNGLHTFGPFWDHFLGYWNAHVKNPDKVLFLKYEDLKEDVTLYVRKIAEFLGCPFSPEEEEKGTVEQISRLCSFDKLKNLEVNKTNANERVKYSTLFRKGEVGDWRNHITPEMAERVKKIMETKFRDTGLTFKLDHAA